MVKQDFELGQDLPDSPKAAIHMAAVLLHPRLKWRWFEKYWKHKHSWIQDAKAAIDELWSLYKKQTVAIPAAPPVVIHAEWSEFDRLQPLKDQLLQYTDERGSADLSAYDSPLPYWINERRQWAQLAQMAFDIYSMPAMSDKPGRVFSIAGITLSVHVAGVLLVPLCSSCYAYAVGNRATLSHLTLGSSDRLYYLMKVTATARVIAMTVACL